MNIAVVAAGTRGDVQPIAALAQALARGGHQVRFVAHPDWQFLVSHDSIEFWSLRGDAPRITHGALIARRPRTVVGQLFATRRHAHSYDDKHLVLEACRDRDLILYGHMYMPAAHIGEALRIPCCAAYVVPYVQTSAFPALLGPSIIHRFQLGGWWNAWTHRFMLSRSHRWDLPWLNAWRQQLGLRAIRDPDTWAREQGTPRLFGHSPTLLPKPSDWPANHHVTGYWYWDPPGGWQPPAALERFLDTSQPVLCASFASSTVERAVWPRVSAAARALNARLLIIAGWNEAPAVMGDHVMVIDSCSLEWLLPRVTMIHAAGASTVGEVLRAGRPSVSMPLMGAQRFYAQRLRRLGIAPAISPHASVRRLTSAIDRALRNPRMRERAAGIGATVRLERGSEQAIDVMTTTYAQKDRAP